MSSDCDVFWCDLFWLWRSQWNILSARRMSQPDSETETKYNPNWDAPLKHSLYPGMGSHWSCLLSQTPISLWRMLVRSNIPRIWLFEKVEKDVRLFVVMMSWGHARSSGGWGREEAEDVASCGLSQTCSQSSQLTTINPQLQRLTLTCHLSVWANLVQLL